jgi:tetraacyldisaccharide 4'-kinase
MNSISSLVLPPLSLIYGAVTRARLAAYRKGLLATGKPNAPVISVGNITTGGTGKTPLVEWICRALAEEGRKVCVLTRGYGRLNPGTRVLVSDGTSVLADVSRAGDEPTLLARRLTGLAAVISDRNRLAAARWAMGELGVNAFVLDDGFQHLGLARDLNILTLDAENPWGGAALLPYGSLREPRAGLSRADCIIITRADSQEDHSELKEEVQRLAHNRPIFVSRMVPDGIRTLENLQSDFVSPPRRLAAFCGLGNPESFYNLLRREGYDLALTRTFSDHHTYTQTDVTSVALEARSAGAKALVTTAKDAVKLQGLAFELPCYVLEIRISIDNETSLRQMMRQALTVSSN